MHKTVAPWRQLSLAALLAAAAIFTGGCAVGGSSIDANTSCKDFLHASPSDQDAAVSKVASDLHAANAVTPLGRPNINYICAGNPDTTLGQAVKATG